MEPFQLPFDPTSPSTRADRLLVVFSDIEMGAGGYVDDFPQSEHFAALIDTYTQKYPPQLPIEMIFNGDTFDFLKIGIEGVYPHYITAEIAYQKWERLAQAHAAFFDALQRFLDSSTHHRVHFVVGNHDAELLFPHIQEAIMACIGHTERVSFPGLALDMGSVHIEHGHQMDAMFRINPDLYWLELEGQSILNLPWGSVALLEVAIPLQPMFYFFDRLKPRKKILELLPEVQELLLSLYWRYWTQDYLRAYWKGTDPFKKFNWSILKEIIYRFRSRDPNTHSFPHYRKMLQQQQDIRLLITGHDHTPGWWSWENRKYLQTGCFRNEFLFEFDEEQKTLTYSPLPNVYAEVWMQGDHPTRSYLVELDPPQTPLNYMPTSLHDILPKVYELLGPQEERGANQKAWEAQEQHEAEHPLENEVSQESNASSSSQHAKNATNAPQNASNAKENS